MIERGPRTGRFLCPLVLVLMLAFSGVAGANPALKGYADYKSLTDQVAELGRSEFVKTTSLGTTLGGRQVHLLTIGTGERDKKPALLIVGNVDAAHIVGSETAMRIARLFAERAKTDDAIRKLLDQYTIYVIPRPNPDGSEKCWQRPYREPVGNARPTDDDRDAEVADNGPADLDGDGWITMMRIADPAGLYMSHPADPRVLILADPKKNEHGRYRLLTEGRDKDHDGRQGRGASLGVSFNRNFTHNYPYFQVGAGPHQVSEVETRAVADFAFAHPNIVLVLTFSPEDNQVHPWKPDAGSEGQQIKNRIMSADAGYQDVVAEMYRKTLAREGCPDSPAGAGSFSEWAYFDYGRWSLAARGWWVPEVAKKSEKDDAKDAKPPERKKGKETSRSADAKKPTEDNSGADEINALKWLAAEKLDGFVNWHPIKHPDYPGQVVEVGGFKPFYRLNPPEKELDALGKKHLTFVTDLLGKMPRLKIQDVKIEGLGEGVYRLTATVVNSGFLSTVSEMGRISQKDYPLQIELDAPQKTEFLQGRRRAMLEKIDGGGGKTERTWLVRFPRETPAAVTVRVWAPAVGSVEKKVSLK